MVGNSNGYTNFPQRLFLTNTQICKAFANVLLANVKFSKTQLNSDGTGSLINLVLESMK